MNGVVNEASDVYDAIAKRRVHFTWIQTSAILLTIAREDQLTANRLRPELLAEKVLEGLAVLRELADTLVKLVRRHLVLAQCPAELSLVVNVRDLGDGLARRS